MAKKRNFLNSILNKIPQSWSHKEFFLLCENEEKKFLFPQFIYWKVVSQFSRFNSHYIFWHHNFCHPKRFFFRFHLFSFYLNFSLFCWLLWQLIDICMENVSRAIYRRWIAVLWRLVCLLRRWNRTRKWSHRKIEFRFISSIFNWIFDDCCLILSYWAPLHILGLN